MKEIDLENIKRWVTLGNNKMEHPVSISAICPACSQNVVFTTKRRHYDAQRDTLGCSSECPSCNQAAHFWLTNLTSVSNKDSDDRASLFMLPAAETRLNLHTVSKRLPKSTMQYCSSTQDVYQSGNFTATRVMVKSTLEAIFSSFLPTGNSQTTLFKTVQDSLPTMDLDKPLTSLAASLRPGEPLDLLLTSPDPATAEAAEALMKLIEKLVHFLYVIPDEFDSLEKQLIALSKQLKPHSSAANSRSESDE